MDEKKISSVEFACWFWNEAKRQNVQDMNSTKLQKLLFIVDGILLAVGVNCIDENARVWPHGPVYPKVFKKTYDKIKSGGYLPDYTQTIDNDERSEIIKKAVKVAFDFFGKKSASWLSEWSHRLNSPWQKAVLESNGKMNCVIDKKIVSDYFKRFVSGN